MLDGQTRARTTRHGTTEHLLDMTVTVIVVVDRRSSDLTRPEQHDSIDPYTKYSANISLNDTREGRRYQGIK